MSAETRPEGLRQQRARLTCEDGLSMALDVYQPADPQLRAPLVVICHGFKGFRTWGLFPHLAQRLALGGRAVALFDYSHNGVGDVDGEFDRLDLFEAQTIERHDADLAMVLDALDAARPMPLSGLRPADDGVHLVGHSMGGGIALMRASRDARVRSVASLNGVTHFARWPAEVLAELEAEGRVSIPNARTGQLMPLGRAWFEQALSTDLQACAAQLTVPALVLAGSEDETVPPSEARELHGWLSGSRLVEVPGGNHTFGARHPWAGWTPALETVASELDGFLPRAG
jgi:pimeloyl-ACP methyl ester carboxylesterase